jgi:EmrB/QacA subfamily drug resistance transporter
LDGGGRSKVLIAGLLMGIFLAAVDSTVVSVAMPTIASSLRGVEIYSWAFTAYILTSTVSGPLWGRISDVYGRKTIYLMGVLVFLAGSFLCGVATDMFQLIVFRAVQGLGGGALLVLTFTLVGELFSLKERAKAAGLTSSVWALASIVGPPLGGLIVDSVGWRWIFYINLPVGAFCVAIALRELSNVRRGGEGIDVRGALLFMGAATALLLYLNEFDRLNGAPAFLFSSALLFGVFLYSERRSSTPLLPLHLFRDRVLRTGFLSNFLAGFIFFGVIAYMPLYLQWVLGLSATASGTAVLPLVLGWVLASNAAARLVVRTSVRIPAIISGFSLLAGTLLLTQLRLGEAVLLTGFGLVGVGMGFTVSTFLITTQTLVPRNILGVATSILSFLRLIGGAIAAAVMWIPLGAAFRRVEPATDLTGLLTASEKLAFTNGLTVSMAVAAGAAAIAALTVFLTPPLRLTERPQGGA